jgi:hypothetical protein
MNGGLPSAKICGTPREATSEIKCGILVGAELDEGAILRFSLAVAGSHWASDGAL